MLVEIEKIKVNNRIRKDFGNIDELANDIKENGLINPPVVSPEMQLLAGERRLRACQQLGWKQIEVRVMTVRDAEHQLNIEINENENRKDFTFSEKLEWARRLERIERVKAEERMKAGKKIDNGEKGEVREIVARKSGFGNKSTYRQAKFIAEHADEEIINKLDNGEISIYKAYITTKNKINQYENEKDNEFQMFITKDKTIKEIKKIKRLEASKEIRRRTKESEKIICSSCEIDCTPIVHWHHIVPIANGGESSEENLIPLCPNCHAIIHRSLSEKNENYDIDRWLHNNYSTTIRKRLLHLILFSIDKDEAIKHYGKFVPIYLEV